MIYLEPHYYNTCASKILHYFNTIIYLELHYYNTCTSKTRHYLNTFIYLEHLTACHDLTVIIRN